MPSFISPTSSTNPGTRPSLSYREDRRQLPGQEKLEDAPSTLDGSPLSANTPVAMGESWNEPFNSETSLFNYIKQSQGNERAGVFEAVDARTNAFLNIPSFLYYPSDLAQNRRYHHFIVFNIYQGTSDQIRMSQRQTALTESAIIASGGFQFGGSLSEGDPADRAVLTNAGMTSEQIKQYFANKRSQFKLLPTDARINSFDRIFQGEVSNLARQATEGKTVTQAMMDSTLAALAAIYESGKNDVTDFVSTITQREMVDMWANEKDTNEVGINGQKLQRPRSERSILVANKRFTIANSKSKDTICLYMPQKIAINDQIVYQEEDMGMAKTLLAAVTGKRGAGSALVEKIGTNFVAGIINKATNIAGVEDFNLQAVRNAATRSVSNPRREVLFRDVGIRSHTFSFEFSPRNSAEAQTVLNIIRMLRFHAYPGLRGGGGHFFTFPAEFEASFMTIDEQGVIRVNNNLPRLPRLALTTVSVDYSGAGDFKTFPDAIPAFIKVDLGFQEMEQLTSEHVINGL